MAKIQQTQKPATATANKPAAQPAPTAPAAAPAPVAAAPAAPAEDPAAKAVKAAQARREAAKRAADKRRKLGPGGAAAAFCRRVAATLAGMADKLGKYEGGEAEAASKALADAGKAVAAADAPAMAVPADAKRKARPAGQGGGARVEAPLAAGQKVAIRAKFAEDFKDVLSDDEMGALVVKEVRGKVVVCTAGGGTKLFFKRAQLAAAAA